MRLFFALWPTDELRSQLAPQRLEVLRHCGGRPSLPLTLHMTLVYVGRVPEPKIAELMTIGDSILQPAFDYQIDVAACFGKANIAWLGTQRVPQALLDLQLALKNAVQAAGFPADPRAFRPHVTVARNIHTFVDPWAVEPVAWRVNQFSLINAITTPKGVRYEPLRDWPLSV